MTGNDTPLLPAPKVPLLLEKPKPKPSAFAQHAKRYSALGLVAFLLIAFAFGWFMHHRKNEAAEKANEAQRDAIPPVTVTPVKRSPGTSELLLPGSLSPITEASLYARASGYVRRRYVDIGDSVRKGQLLADIESPDLDAQVEQGQATVAQGLQQLNQARTAVTDALARLALAKVTRDRYETLLAQDSIAGQDVDTQRQVYDSAVAAVASSRANVGAAAQNVQAARANVRRLGSLQAFERLTAPFDGVITARNVDEGALISTAGASLTTSDASSYSANGGASSGTTGGTATGSSGGSTGSSSGSTGGSGQGVELFRIAQVDRLRVYVTVPQESAGMVQVGTEASVFLQEFPGSVHGQVTRTARSLDPSARTLLTEVQIANDGHAFMPGMYAQVRFTSDRNSPPLLVAGEAIITRGTGTMVALMQDISPEDRAKLPQSPNRDKAQRVHLQPVQIGRDYGTEVEITGGLEDGEQVVMNPGDEVQENAVMVPQGPASSASGSASGAGGGSDKKGGGSSGKSGKSDKPDKSDKSSKSGKPGKSGKDDASNDSPPPVQPPILASAPAASAPAGTTKSPLSGPSDRSPSGLASPSMTAPTQGGPQGKKGGK